MFKKVVIIIAGAGLFVASMSLGFGATNAFANKVDCAKVMSELGAGKKSKDVAKDLSISTSSVYRCKQKAGATTKTSAIKTTAAKPMATASPMHK